MGGLSLVTKGMLCRGTSVEKSIGGGGMIKVEETLPKPLILVSHVDITDENGKKKRKKQSESIIIKTKGVKID